MILPGKGISWKRFFKSLYEEWDKDDVTDFSGALAYAAVLATFPFLIFVVALAGLVIDPRTVESALDQVARVAPGAARDILGKEMHRILQAKPGLLTVSIVGALYAASGGVSAMMRALNTMYDVKESRPFWKVQGIAFLVTILGAVGAIIGAGATIVTPIVAKAVGGPVGTAILWIRYPVAVVVVMFVVACLYYFLPDVEQKFKFITPGSVFAVLAWLAASIGFSIYVSHFNSYGVTYGALGGIIIFLVWLWISAQAVLIGAEMNAILEATSPEGKRVGKRTFAREDTGPDVPKSEVQAEQGREDERDRGLAAAGHARSEPAPEAQPAPAPAGLATRPPSDIVVRPVPTGVVREKVFVPRRSPVAVAGAVLAAIGVGVVVGRKLR